MPLCNRIIEDFVVADFFIAIDTSWAAICLSGTGGKHNFEPGEVQHDFCPGPGLNPKGII
jgi:hypothetical protein